MEAGQEPAFVIEFGSHMAKSVKREYVWLQCTECGDLNYRVTVNVQGGTPKLELKKYCPRTRKRELHKVKRK